MKFEECSGSKVIQIWKKNSFWGLWVLLGITLRVKSSNLVEKWKKGPSDPDNWTLGQGSYQGAPWGWNVSMQANCN